MPLLITRDIRFFLWVTPSRQEFRRNQEDYCLYTKKLSDGSQIILILYVDDMLIAGKSKSEIANFE